MIDHPRPRSQVMNRNFAPIPALVFIVSALLGLAGCGDDPAPPIAGSPPNPGSAPGGGVEPIKPPPKPSSPPHQLAPGDPEDYKVDFEVLDQPIAPGDTLHAKITNSGDSTLTYGVCPQIQTEDGQPLIAEPTACIEIAAITGPGESGSVDATVPEDAAPGTYLLVHQVNAEDGTPIDLRAEFEIGD